MNADRKHEDDGGAAFREHYKRQVLPRGRPLSRPEAIKFLRRKFWMGPPERLPRGKRGPQTMRTQYDEAYSRRKDLFRRLVKAPKARVGVSAHDAEAIDAVIREMLAAGVPRHKRVSAVQRRMELDGKPIPSDRELRRRVRAFENKA